MQEGEGRTRRRESGDAGDGFPLGGIREGPESLPATLHLSLAYNVAAALMDRELTARQFSRERIRDRATWDLASRVHLSLSEVMAQRMRDRVLIRA